MGVVVRRFGVYRVVLEPTLGSELRKTRPCCVISPDEMNAHLATVLIAPMTTSGRAYPTRIPYHFAGQSGHIALDQIRAVDRVRLVADLGDLQQSERQEVLTVLMEMLAP